MSEFLGLSVFFAWQVDDLLPTGMVERWISPCTIGEHY